MNTRKSHIPKLMVREIANMREKFMQFSQELGNSSPVSKSHWELLPSNVRNALCFKDSLSGVWRYDHGIKPSKMSTGKQLYGAFMFPEVSVLVRCTDTLLRCFEPATAMKILSRLSDSNRHMDYLQEVAPLVYLSKDVHVAHEVHCCLENENTIDWEISKTGYKSVLLEVKNRIIDSYELMERTDKGERDEYGRVPWPKHEVSKLFRGVKEKFIDANGHNKLHGAWIHTGLKQYPEKIESVYNEQLKKVLHFVILGDYKQDIFIHAVSPEVRRQVLEILNRYESKRFIE